MNELSITQKYPVSQFNLLGNTDVMVQIPDIKSPVIQQIKLDAREGAGDIYLQQRASKAWTDQNGRHHPATPNKYAINGIVFICDQAQNSPASNEIFLTGASVVNGCQTLNTLYNAVQNGKLNDSVYILVRVISIADYSERMRITEFLNSQTPIRDSYFIANHTIVRDLQEKLLEKGYFLERQVNEYEYMKEHGIDIQGKTIMELESVIQYYVGYWINRNASLAKRGKNALFDKNKIEELLVGLTADKVIEAYNVYNAISEVLTMYRKTRRNSSKDEFAQYIGVTQTWMNENINGFRFMNTGDIILLNAYKNLKDQYEKKGIVGLKQKDIIIDSIFIVRDVINKEKEEKENNVSLLTKNSGIFSKVQVEIGNLEKRVEHKGV